MILGDGTVSFDEYSSNIDGLFNHTFDYCQTGCNQIQEALSSCGYFTDGSKKYEKHAKFVIQTCRLNSPVYKYAAECIKNNPCSLMDRCFETTQVRDSDFVQYFKRYFASSPFGFLDKDASTNKTFEGN